MTKNLEAEIEKLFAALKLQWALGYDQALEDAGIDPETFDTRSRNPWSYL